MDEPLTISKDAPEQKSMDYSFLREEGIKYIQSVAGKIWTDYNTHDPGVTILEILCYALTDLGYRTSYDIKDLIAPPDDAQTDGSYDFFTAAEIMPTAPVTSNDYRKLMIDVAVEGPEPECRKVGVKNAWIEKASGPELDVFVDKTTSKLLYSPAKPTDKPLDLKILYNVLLEFGTCDTFGDLNENKLVRDFVIASHPPDPGLEGVLIRVDAEFPRWDDPDVDWEDDTSISLGIKKIDLSFHNLDGNFTITYSLSEANEVVLDGSKTSPSGPAAIAGLSQITQDLNDFIFGPNEGMIIFYRQKIEKIKEIAGEVKAKLHANRSLCEDFLEIHALRIEEILVCSDIELEADADVDLAEAQIFHNIAKFLSPSVHFYTLGEMATRCYDAHRFVLSSINKTTHTFTIDGLPDPLPEPATVVTIDSENDNSGIYTIKSSHRNKTNPGLTDITVEESIPTDLVSGSEHLILGDPENDPCNPIETIFEGPLLDHGFIDDEELEQADRRNVIHVSDLIQIIMDTDGVAAVKNIQIANDPQDNVDGSIPSKNVRWCLKLAFDQNYVPRLNTDRSRLTFYKDQLPFKATRSTVESLMKELEANERPQKLSKSGPFDIAPPSGNFKDAEEFISVQNEFPLVYGIGEEGLPSENEQGPRSVLPTQIDARQLKGYLMHFDQLLANYLAQLAHVKDLFSMNPEKDNFGNFVIGRTYYTQSLIGIVPDVEPLLADEAGYATTLNELAESDSLFWDRRNRFLDHLIARFAEQFTDYALLTNRISGTKAQKELIEDKLAFLNGYPELSSRRGTALNYRTDCNLWHKDNVSGLEHRASLLTGIDDRPASLLNFSPRFKITGSEPDITFSIENDLAEVLLKSTASYQTKDEAKEALETVVDTGVLKQNYEVTSDNETEFSYCLICNGQVIAESDKKDFSSGDPGGDTDLAIDELVDLLRDEFFNNPESNRHNLACPLLNYFDVSIQLLMEQNPPAYTVVYDLYENPFQFAGSDPLLNGEQTINGPDREKAPVESIDTGTSTIVVKGHITEDMVAGDTIHIAESVDNDGVYTINSFSIDGDNTAIMVDESIPSDTSPLGMVLYNIITEEELNEHAESAVIDVLWKVVANGAKRSSYTFSPPFPPFDEPYRFNIRDFRGNELGESTETDFNKALADEISNLNSAVIEVTAQDAGPDDEPDSYSITSATARGPYIDIAIDEAPEPAPGLNWTLGISDTFGITSIQKQEQTFIVESDLTDKLLTADSVTVSGHSSNNGTYTIYSLRFDGTSTLVTVKEPIPDGEISEKHDPHLSYKKSFDVVKSSGKTITVKGGGEESAAEKMIGFISEKFFSHEGMHLIEHILLRPKTNGPVFGDAGDNTLTGGLADNGQISFNRRFDIIEADSATKKITVDGDQTALLVSGKTIHIIDAPLLRGAFTVDSVSFADPVTEITVREPLAADIMSESSAGSIEIPVEETLSGVSPSELKLTVPGNIADSIPGGSLLEITGSTDGLNNGRYLTGQAENAGAETEITINKAEKEVQDRLLSVNLDEDCDCALDNPYTCMAHVILPYWPGRFTNTDFRTFFEKTLRREAPAHIYLNICWVSYRHMAEFERAWKAWLIESAKHETDTYTLSTTLDELIDSIEQLRNVYPKGTLHDCDEDENLENSIILNHSALGEI